MACSKQLIKMLVERSSKTITVRGELVPFAVSLSNRYTIQFDERILLS